MPCKWQHTHVIYLLIWNAYTPFCWYQKEWRCHLHDDYTYRFKCLLLYSLSSLDTDVSVSIFSALPLTHFSSFFVKLCMIHILPSVSRSCTYTLFEQYIQPCEIDKPLTVYIYYFLSLEQLCWRLTQFLTLRLLVISTSWQLRTVLPHSANIQVVSYMFVYNHLCL